MNYCKIENGVVTNVAVFDAEKPLAWGNSDELWLQNDDAGIGWTYANGAFVAPTQPEPEPVVPDQVRAEAQRRFMAISANARALNQVLGTPIPAGIVALSREIIAKGEEIAAMIPIPQDYAAADRWPAAGI
jgi:hypothetical protein